MLCALYEPVGHLHAVVVKVHRPVQLSHTHDLQYNRNSGLGNTLNHSRFSGVLSS
jgi:hypothetical protein